MLQCIKCIDLLLLVNIILAMIFNRKFLQIFILILSMGSFAQTYAAHDQSHSNHDHITQESLLYCIDCYVNFAAAQPVGLDFRIKYVEFSSTSIASIRSYGINIYDPQTHYYQSRAP